MENLEENMMKEEENIVKENLPKVLALALSALNKLLDIVKPVLYAPFKLINKVANNFTNIENKVGEVDYKKLHRSGVKLDDIEIPANKAEQKIFNDIAKKYDIQYAIRDAPSSTDKIPKKIVFFNEKDRNIMQNVIKEYTHKIASEEKGRESKGNSLKREEKTTEKAPKNIKTQIALPTPKENIQKQIAQNKTPFMLPDNSADKPIRFAIEINQLNVDDKVLANTFRKALEVEQGASGSHFKGKIEYSKIAEKGYKNVSIGDRNIAAFEAYAKKNNIQFALQKNEALGKSFVIIHAKRANDYRKAFHGFAKDTLDNADKRPTLNQELGKVKQKVKAVDKTLTPPVKTKSLSIGGR